MAHLHATKILRTSISLKIDEGLKITSKFNVLLAKKY